MKLARAALLVAAALSAAMSTYSLSAAPDEAGSGKLALEIDIDGAIGPATARHVKEALATAGERRHLHPLCHACRGHGARDRYLLCCAKRKTALQSVRPRRCKSIVKEGIWRH